MADEEQAGMNYKSFDDGKNGSASEDGFARGRFVGDRTLHACSGRGHFARSKPGTVAKVKVVVGATKTGI